jgi:hypothetical protein
MTLRRLSLMLLSTASVFAWQAAALAADLLAPEPFAEQDQVLPAVSAINGKWELDAGVLSPVGGVFRAAGSVSMPLGDRFGVQLDGSLALTGAGVVYGGALHAFTRDPSRYLLGVTAGVVVAPANATLVAVGPEGELYLDRMSFEGWAGFAAINYVNPATPDIAGVFAMGDIAYYPMDDLRLNLGGRYLLGELSVRAGTEYLFHQFSAPLSLTAEARLYNTGAYAFRVGLKGYLGGNDDQKSLIDRHRQDDPENKAIDLYNASGDLLYAQPPPDETPPDPEAVCLATPGMEWVFDYGLETFVCQPIVPD